MRYISTRGSAPILPFDEGLLAGLARDGGLYVPEAWPQFGGDDIRALARLPYAELATRLMLPFLGGSDRSQKTTCHDNKYCQSEQIIRL